MAIPGSGPISLTGTIQGEFGGATPTSMSEYLRGGANVPDTATNVNIKSSAVNMSFSNYYNGAKFTLAFDNADNINLVDRGGSGNVYQVIYTINPSGTFTKQGLQYGLDFSFGPDSWGSPTGGTPGSNYEARLNISTVATASGGATTFSGVSITSTGFTSWQSLSSARAIVVTSNDFGLSRLIGTLYIRNISTLAEISRSFDILADPTY